MKRFLLLGLLVIPYCSRAVENNVPYFEAPYIIAPGDPACQFGEYARQYPDACKTIRIPNPKYKAPKIRINGIPTHFTQEQIIIDFLNEKTGSTIDLVDLTTQ